MDTPQSNRPLYSNTVIGTLAADGWAVRFGTARRGLGGLHPVPFSSCLTLKNSIIILKSELGSLKMTGDVTIR